MTEQPVPPEAIGAMARLLLAKNGDRYRAEYSRLVAEHLPVAKVAWEHEPQPDPSDPPFTLHLAPSQRYGQGCRGDSQQRRQQRQQLVSQTNNSPVTSPIPKTAPTAGSFAFSDAFHLDT